jgi:exodeoxyribonuclease-5
MTSLVSALNFLTFQCATEEQTKAILAMQSFIKEDNQEDFLILCGAAGTGKTSLTSALIDYLNKSSIAFKLAAPTGRAARILGSKSNTANSTIHSLIYNAVPNPETGEVIFRLKDNQDQGYKVYIIDEASMISAKPDTNGLSLFKCPDSLLKDLAQYVKSGNSKNKIILLGDRNQLPPINENEAKALCPEYLRNEFGWQGEAHFLTQVIRQGAESEIMRNAISLRKAIENGGQRVDLEGSRFGSGYTAIKNYVKDYRKFGYENCISIACSHKQNVWFNQAVRGEIYGANTRIVGKDDLLIVTRGWDRSNKHLYSGDHVVVDSVNLFATEEVGGLHFAPIKLRSKSLDGKDQLINDVILLESLFNPSGQLPTEQEKKLRHDRYSKNSIYRKNGNPKDDKYVGAIRLTYGHSITCNKAQGGEWEKVYMNTFRMPSLKYQYTVVTRAKSSLVYY